MIQNGVDSPLRGEVSRDAVLRECLHALQSAIVMDLAGDEDGANRSLGRRQTCVGFRSYWAACLKDAALPFLTDLGAVYRSYLEMGDCYAEDAIEYAITEVLRFHLPFGAGGTALDLLRDGVGCDLHSTQDRIAYCALEVWADLTFISVWESARTLVAPSNSTGPNVRVHQTCQCDC